MLLEGTVEMTRCLVVDEDQQERSALGSLLGEYGFELSESGTVDGALQHCRRFAPDVVVTVERLGGMAAAEFVKRIRSASRGRKPVVLVCADKADSGKIGRAIIEGAAEYLLKPFDREILEFKLRQVGLL
jgi:two-component system, chemotaxis family, chemotaxis protein CheY